MEEFFKKHILDVVLVVLIILLIIATVVSSNTQRRRYDESANEYAMQQVAETTQVMSMELEPTETVIPTPTATAAPEPTSTPEPTPEPIPTENNGKTQPTGRGGERNYKSITVIATAYAPYDNKSGMCNDGTPDTTATMTKPRQGVVAADPSRLPYGTQLYIPGYGMGIVEDTGGGLRRDKQNIRIDLFVATHEEAVKWGRQEIEVYIIDNDY